MFELYSEIVLKTNIFCLLFWGLLEARIIHIIIIQYTNMLFESLQYGLRRISPILLNNLQYDLGTISPMAH